MNEMAQTIREALPGVSERDALRIAYAADDLWRVLTENGFVDTFGGMESRRVLATALRTIREEANCAP